MKSDGENNRTAGQVGILIVGGGPIGLELAAALERAGLSYVLLEAEGIGNTICRWPRNTHFYSAPERVAIAGVPFHSVDQKSPTGEEYLAYLRSVVEGCDLNVRVYRKVRHIRPEDGNFTVTADLLSGGREVWTCANVVLATGGMAMPNRLDVPGDDLPHVSYRFVDPHVYFRRSLLIVGGGNSALEVALRSWRAGARVTISYRHDAFDPARSKPDLAPEVEMLIDKGEIGFLPRTTPVEITRDAVLLADTDEDGEKIEGRRRTVQTDAVHFATGYRADMSLFRDVGVELVGEGERPKFDPDTMQTNVPGIYVAGTAAAGTQTSYELFIETCHHHVEKIVHAVGGGTDIRTGGAPERNYDFTFRDLYRLNTGGRRDGKEKEESE